MKIYCATQWQGDYLVEYGYEAQNDIEAREIAAEYELNYRGRLDEQNVPDDEKALIERDFYEQTVH